jgi:hypothetical protein
MKQNDRRRMRSILWLAPLLMIPAACGRGSPQEEPSSAPDAAWVVVDSLIPMDQALDRFRGGLVESVGLSGGADSRDDLVEKVVRAFEAQDTMAFEALAVNRAEWAFLYYPHNVLSKPPYELPPALAWFQLQEANRKGVLRGLRELGGHRVTYQGYTCSQEPVLEGENRIWTGCTVMLRRDDGDPVTITLFAAILERDGRFAVLSYDNDF